MRNAIAVSLEPLGEPILDFTILVIRVIDSLDKSWQASAQVLNVSACVPKDGGCHECDDTKRLGHHAQEYFEALPERDEHKNRSKKRLNSSRKITYPRWRKKRTHKLRIEVHFTVNKE